VILTQKLFIFASADKILVLCYLYLPVAILVCDRDVIVEILVLVLQIFSNENFALHVMMVVSASC